MEKRSCPLLSLLARLRACVSAWTLGRDLPNCLSVHPAISQRRSSVFPPARLSSNVCRIPCFALLLPPSLLPSQESRLRSFVRSFVWVCLLAFSPCCHAQGRCTLSPSFSPPVSSPSPQPISWLRQEKGEWRRGCFLYTRSLPFTVPGRGAAVSS